MNSGASTAQAAAAAWNSALQNASAQSVNNLNQYQARAGLVAQQHKSQNPLVAAQQQHMKSSTSKGVDLWINILLINILF